MHFPWAEQAALFGPLPATLQSEQSCVMHGCDSTAMPAQCPPYWALKLMNWLRHWLPTPHAALQSDQLPHAS